MGQLFRKDQGLPSQMYRVIIDKHGNVSAVTVDRIGYATDETALEEQGKIVVDLLMSREQRAAYARAMSEAQVPAKPTVGGKAATRENWLKNWREDSIWSFLEEPVRARLEMEIAKRRKVTREEIDMKRASSKAGRRNAAALEESAELIALAHAKGTARTAEQDAEIANLRKVNADLAERMARLEALLTKKAKE